MKHKLKATDVVHAKPRAKAYKLTDGEGLYLRVNPTGARSWRYKYRINGFERTYTIGSFPAISLKQARVFHEQARATVALGEHPLVARRRVVATTFEGVARAWIEQRSVNWSPAYKAQVRRVLDTDVFPRIGSKPISRVAPIDLLEILEEVASRRVPRGKKRERSRGAATVALFIRQWASAIMRFAVARKLADRDIAADLRGAVTRPQVRNNPGLPVSELPSFISALRSYTGRSKWVAPATAVAVELLLLTFVRTGELRRAEWSEFDLMTSTWTIPACRMKMGREHVVPLSHRASELVKWLHDGRTSDVLVFPNRRRATDCMSATTVNRALEYMGYGGKLSGHGFRSTASTLLHEAGWSPIVIEKQLAHEQRNRVAAAYNKAEYLTERREMMQFWSDFVREKASPSIANEGDGRRSHLPLEVSEQ